MAKGNFYYYFNDKQALAKALLDWHRDLACADFDLDRIPGQTSPRQALLDMDVNGVRCAAFTGAACPDSPTFSPTVRSGLE